MKGMAGCNQAFVFDTPKHKVHKIKRFVHIVFIRLTEYIILYGCLHQLCIDHTSVLAEGLA